MYMEKPVAIGNGLFYACSSPQKSRTPYNKRMRLFCCFPVKQSLDSPSAKTLLTLDLKYYEKNSLQI